MNKQFSLFLTSFLAFFSIQGMEQSPALLQRSCAAWKINTDDFNQSPFFNTAIIGNYELVAQKLCNEKGFERITFKSSDNIELQGLLRKGEDPLFSILLCSGFYPGRKEGICTFVEMLPENTNMLFYDARGHGKSKGRFISNLCNYGVDDYKDVHGALQLMKSHSDKPIFVYGICAGAFHAARALTQLTDEQRTQYDIKGLVFDSGFTSITDTIDVPYKHFHEKLILNFFRKKGEDKDVTKKKWSYRISCACITGLLNMYRFFVEPAQKKHDNQTNLMHSANKIGYPILFIHSEDDGYASIDAVKSLQEKCPQSISWWITEKSEHATHHLKHKNEYCDQLTAFLQRQLNNDNQS